MGDWPSLKAFAIVILGGLGNITGATLGGFILAFVEELGAGYISSGYRDAMGFLLIIVVLLIKPTGLVRAEGAHRMRRAWPLLWALAFLRPSRSGFWISISFMSLITTGIFIIAAMSLNLLLGYTGQLSLGHVAFFGIGAYASALTSLGFDIELPGGFHVVHEPWPAVVGFFIAIVIAGLCGYLIGKLSFKVRGAYFVIVTISFAEVTRLVALNWVELTQGPLALNNIPPYTLWLPGLGECRILQQAELLFSGR